MSWRVERRVDGVAALHGIGVPDVAERTVRWCEPERPAIVIGSAQPDSDIDRPAAERLGVEVIRRRSGGGAVLVEPGDIVWVDVLVPGRDPLWHVDVGKAFWWLGDVWTSTLAALGHPGAGVHRGPLVTTAWSRKVCFAGLGPGEVTLEGRKVVGVSQRRTRAGALFQCALHRRLDLERLASLLLLSNDDRRAVVEAVGQSTAALGKLDVAELETAFIDRLPA